MPEVVADAIAFVLLLMTDRSEASRRNREPIALGLLNPPADVAPNKLPAIPSRGAPSVSSLSGHPPMELKSSRGVDPPRRRYSGGSAALPEAG